MDFGFFFKWFCICFCPQGCLIMGFLSNLIVFYETSLFLKKLLFFIIMCWRKKCHVHRLCWKEPRQRTHLNVIEGDVWFTSRYIQFLYDIIFCIENPIQQITPFITHSPIFVWEPFPIHKVVKIVLYRLIHGIRSKLMVNLYNLDVSTIQKYINIMCEILLDKDKIYKIYIHLPIGQVYYLSLKYSKIWLVFNKLQMLLMVRMFHNHSSHPRKLQLP